MKKTMRKILFAAFLLFCSLLLCIGLSAHTFRDVTQFEDAIELLSQIEVIKGYNAYAFGPDDNVTRWQMALLISKLRTGNTETAVWAASDDEIVFTDIVNERHYPASIAYAHSNGIIIGQAEGIFNPDANITVQDGLTMCVRALGYPRSGYDSGYPNSYISKAKELGLLEGLYNLSYTAPLTRGQTAQMLYNALFARAYAGNTLAAEAFGFIDSDMVLAATDTLRIQSSVAYAKKGSLTFCLTDAYGKLGRAVTLDAARFELSDPNESIGALYHIQATADLSRILSLTAVSKTLSAAKTASLIVNSLSNTVTMGGTAYTVKTARTYALEAGKTPASRELLVWSLCDDLVGHAFTSGSPLTAAQMSGTNEYYSLVAYDDNSDGFADRAFYRCYAVGRYQLENGVLAIAGGNAPSSVTMTGKTAAEGDLVLYCYDSQTKRLDISKILMKIDGSISSYTASNNRITLDRTEYSLGSSNLPGANPAAVAREIAALSSPVGCKLTAYADTERRLIVSVTLKKEEISLSGNYYNTDVAMVSSISYTQASSGGGISAYYPVVYFNLDVLTPYIVHSVDGVNATTSNIFDLVKVGDLMHFTRNSSLTGTAGNGSAMTVAVLDLDNCSGKATCTTMQPVSYITVDESGLLKVYENSVTATGEILTVSLDDDAFVCLWDGGTAAPVKYVNSASGGNLRTDAWAYDPFDSSKAGFKLDGYYSIYVSTLSTLVSSKAYAIYLRPFDFLSYASENSLYNNIVYIPASSIQAADAALSPASVYTGFDLTAGSNVEVTVPTAQGRLTSAGYYKVLNGAVIDSVPLTESVSNDSISLTLSPTLTSVQNNGSDGYVITVNGKSWRVKKSSIRLYQLTSDLSMSQIALTAETSSAYLSMLQLTPSFLKAVFTTPPKVSTSFYSGPFYLVIGG